MFDPTALYGYPPTARMLHTQPYLQATIYISTPFHEHRFRHSFTCRHQASLAAEVSLIWIYPWVTHILKSPVYQRLPSNETTLPSSHHTLIPPLTTTLACSHYTQTNVGSYCLTQQYSDSEASHAAHPLNISILTTNIESSSKFHHEKLKTAFDCV